MRCIILYALTSLREFYTENVPLTNFLRRSVNKKLDTLSTQCLRVQACFRSPKNFVNFRLNIYVVNESQVKFQSQTTVKRRLHIIPESITTRIFLAYTSSVSSGNHAGNKES